MKKIISLWMCVVMAAAFLTGCNAAGGQSETEKTSQEEKSPETAELTENTGEEVTQDSAGVKIGVLYCLLSAPAVKVFSKGIEETAAGMGIELVELDGEWDATKQADQMDTLISQGVDAIILNPVDGSALVPACKKAFEAGIPIICGAMNVDESGQDYIIGYVGADDSDIGYQAAKMMAENLPDGGKIAIVEGAAGASASTNRTSGFEKGMEGSALEIVSKMDGNFETAKAMTVTEDILTKNPDIAGIFVHDDTMALGVVQAMKALGYTGEDIKVISYNGSANGAKMIKDGDILASAVQPLYQEGKVSVEVCLKAINGEKTEKWYKDQIDMLTVENVDTYDQSLLW